MPAGQRGFKQRVGALWWAQTGKAEPGAHASLGQSLAPSWSMGAGLEPHQNKTPDCFLTYNRPTATPVSGRWGSSAFRPESSREAGRLRLGGTPPSWDPQCLLIALRAKPVPGMLTPFG
jgi:hypothetical protein